MSHYSPKFLAAYERVFKVLEEQGEFAAKVAFRDEMVAIGHEERIRNLYRINDKLSAKAVWFKPNAPQEEYLKTKTKRGVILKCRQVGFTTLSGVRGLDKALWEENMKTGIMAHLQLTVGTIFTDLVKFTYEWFKRDWGHLYSPTEKSANATELAFLDDGLGEEHGRPLNSSMRVLYDFRGKTVYFLHVSEASRVEDERLLGSLQGVPHTGEAILESTPNGRGGQFHRLWQLHRANGKLAPFQGFFVPWFAFYPETPDDWENKDLGEFTSYEKDILEADIGITPAHIAWRRWCIEANCNGDPEQFENEYPTNDMDCFLTGEASVFSSSLLKSQDRQCREAAFTGYLVEESGKHEMHDDPKGYLAVWTKPKPGHLYVVGADPSGGVGKDRSAAYVKDRNTKEIVARIWGDLQPSDFAKEIFKVSTWYNKAYVNCEINNHGHVVIEKLKEMRYPFLYKRQVIDEQTNRPTTKIGFLTTNDSKLRITEKLKISMQNGDIKLLDKSLIDEMSTFVQVSSKNGRGIKREAASGSHDDLVMAAALTEEMEHVRGELVTGKERAYADAIEKLDVDPFTGF